MLIVAVLAAASYLAIQHKRTLLEATRIESVIMPVRRARAPAATPKPAPPEPAVEPMRMTINLLHDSWVILEADGKEVINARMHRGDTRTIEAKDSFVFRTIGNAAGVELTLNDAKLPPLGGDGEVVHDRVFDRSSLRTTP